MPGVSSPLFKAHLLLLRWGLEALGQETGDIGELAGTATSPADDGSGEPVDEIAASDPAYGDQCPRNRAG